MTSHTPTPWKYQDEYVRGPVETTDGNVIANTRCNYGRSLAEANANGEFIARACNAHDALVDVLERALRNIPDGPSALRFDMEAALKLARGEA